MTIERRGLLLLVFLIASCREAPQKPGTAQGHLEMRWSGAQEGRMSASAEAGWCGLRRVVEIRAVRGDTGVALALYPESTLVAGVYPVVAPVRAESIPPAAGVAVRWLAKTTVQGFQGESGRVRLVRSSSGQLSGSVNARARSVSDTQRISLSGTFQDLTVRPDSLGCAPASVPEEDPEAVDTEVD